MLSRRPIWRSLPRSHSGGGETKTLLPSVGARRSARGTYHCSLSEQPGYLVPARLLADDVRDGEALVMNPAAWCSWRDGDRPARVTECFPLPDEFLDGDLIWLYDVGAATWAPFWLDAAARDAVSGLGPGQAAPLDPASRLRAALAFAGVLVRPGAENQKRQPRGEVFDEASRSFRQRGFCSLSGLIHPFHLGSLRRYYRQLLRTGGMTLGDRSSPLRFVAHNDGVALFFHQQLARTVGAIAGVAVVPSYTYVTAYQGEAELPPHTDRPQCEYSISLLVDFTPEPDDVSPWPLHLSTAGERVTVRQGLGDCLLYRGRQLSHFRNRLPEGMTSTSMLFHFVDRDFVGPMD